MRRLAVASLGASILAGCQTANYTSEDIQKVSNREMQRIKSQAGEEFIFNPEVVKPQSFDYNAARKVAVNYSRAPKARFRFFSPDLEAALNMQGPINSAVNGIRYMEKQIPHYWVNNGVVIGSPDSNFVFSRSADNQFSSRSALKGVDFFVSEDNVNGNLEDIAIFADEVTGYKGGRENSEYDITIVFGVGEHLQRKERKDFLYGLETARNTAIGGAFAGLPGAGIGFGISVVEGVGASVEGSVPPKGTILTRNFGDYISGRSPVAEINEILQKRDRLGADIIFVPMKDNLGVVYVDNPQNIVYGSNSVTIRTDSYGAGNLAGFLVKTAELAGAAYILSRDDCDSSSQGNGGVNQPGGTGGSGGVMGGQTGAPGATSPGVSGGSQTGGAGAR